MFAANESPGSNAASDKQGVCVEFLGMALMAVGGIGGFVFGIMILIKAFQTSIWWGLGSLFIPIVSLVFVAMHWPLTKKPFLYLVGCWVLMLVGATLGGSAAGLR